MGNRVERIWRFVFAFEFAKIQAFWLNLWILLRAVALVPHFCYAKTASPQPPRLDFVKSRNDGVVGVVFAKYPPPTPSAREGAFHLSQKSKSKITLKFSKIPQKLKPFAKFQIFAEFHSKNSNLKTKKFKFKNQKFKSNNQN